MSAKQHLRDFVDAVIKSDDTAAKAAWQTYAVIKSKEVLKEKAETPIKMKGNDLLVNGKVVGQVKHDVDDDKGIEFTCDGKTKKFDDLKALYAHVGKEHKLNEGEDKLFALYVGKKGSGKLHIQFSGSKQDCLDEKQSWKDDVENKGSVYKIVPVASDSEAPSSITESAKDYESEIQKLPNRDESENVTAFEDGEDGKQETKDGATKAKAKKIIDNVKAGKKA